MGTHIPRRCGNNGNLLIAIYQHRANHADICHTNVCLFEGAQFWRSNRKIVAIKTERAAYIRKRSSSKRKKHGDFLDQLKRIVAADTSDDDFDEPGPLIPSTTRQETPMPSMEEQINVD